MKWEAVQLPQILMTLESTVHGINKPLHGADGYNLVPAQSLVISL